MKVHTFPVFLEWFILDITNIISFGDLVFKPSKIVLSDEHRSLGNNIVTSGDSLSNYY